MSRQPESAPPSIRHQPMSLAKLCIVSTTYKAVFKAYADNELPLPCLTQYLLEHPLRDQVLKMYLRDLDYNIAPLNKLLQRFSFADNNSTVRHVAYSYSEADDTTMFRYDQDAPLQARDDAAINDPLPYRHGNPEEFYADDDGDSNDSGSIASISSDEEDDHHYYFCNGNRLSMPNEFYRQNRFEANRRAKKSHLLRHNKTPRYSFDDAFDQISTYTTEGANIAYCKTVVYNKQTGEYDFTEEPSDCALPLPINNARTRRVSKSRLDRVRRRLFSEGCDQSPEPSTADALLSYTVRSAPSSPIRNVVYWQPDIEMWSDSEIDDEAEGGAEDAVDADDEDEGGAEDAVDATDSDEGCLPESDFIDGSGDEEAAAAADAHEYERRDKILSRKRVWPTEYLPESLTSDLYRGGMDTPESAPKRRRIFFDSTDHYDDDESADDCRPSTSSAGRGGSRALLLQLSALLRTFDTPFDYSSLYETTSYAKAVVVPHHHRHGHRRLFASHSTVMAEYQTRTIQSNCRTQRAADDLRHLYRLSYEHQIACYTLAQIKHIVWTERHSLLAMMSLVVRGKTPHQPLDAQLYEMVRIQKLYESDRLIKTFV